MISFLLLFAFFNFGDSRKRFFKPKLKSLSTQNDDSTVCNLCTNLMTGITGMINDGIDEDQIQTKMLSACLLYPGEYSTICQTIGTTYFPIFIHLAREKVSEEKACIKMGYCSDLESKMFQ